MSIDNRRLLPVGEEDIPATYAYLALKRKDSHCLHCSKHYVPKHDVVMYTEIEDKIIWWHIRPTCTPDPKEEYEN